MHPHQHAVPLKMTNKLIYSCIGGPLCVTVYSVRGFVNSLSIYYICICLSSILCLLIMFTVAAPFHRIKFQVGLYVNVLGRIKVTDSNSFTGRTTEGSKQFEMLESCKSSLSWTGKVYLQSFNKYSVDRNISNLSMNLLLYKGGINNTD